MREYMSFKPIRLSRPVGSQWLGRMSIIAVVARKRAMAAALVIALFAGGGVSYAAEGALPGDALYGVKVSLNENVRGAFAVTPEGKAQWKARRVERRLEEAVALAAGGRMTTEESARLAAAIEAQSADAASAFKKLEKEKPNSALAANADFDAILTAHSDLLEGIGNAVGNGDLARALAKFARGKARIAVIVNTGTEKGEEARASKDAAALRAETALSPAKTLPSGKVFAGESVHLTLTNESINRLAALVTQSLAEAADLLAEARRGTPTLDAERAATFRAEILAVEATYMAGVRFAESGNLVSAYQTLGRALNKAHRLLVAIKASTRLNIDVSVGENGNEHTEEGSTGSSGSPVQPLLKIRTVPQDGDTINKGTPAPGELPASERSDADRHVQSTGSSTLRVDFPIR